jgi:hypothetical protein
MAHFAKLDNNNKVLQVVVVANDVITINGEENEQLGIEFLSNLFNHSNWVQTSINGNIRYNYAQIDGVYDSKNDAFIGVKPYPSWILNTQTYQWEPPITMPLEEGIYYVWKEDKQKWQSQIVPPLDASNIGE